MARLHAAAPSGPPEVPSVAEDVLLVDKNDGIATLTLNRPE